MTRVLHFGAIERNGHNGPSAIAALERRLAGSHFVVQGTSFTQYGEPPTGPGDPIHVTLTIDAVFDDDGFHGRLGVIDARWARDTLADLLTDGSWRLADYWIQSSDVWGEDEQIHGLWALESISGRNL